MESLNSDGPLPLSKQTVNQRSSLVWRYQSIHHLSCCSLNFYETYRWRGLSLCSNSYKTGQPEEMSHDLTQVWQKTGWMVDKSIFYLEIYSTIFIIALCFGAEAKSTISYYFVKHYCLQHKKKKKKNYLRSIKCQKTVCYEYKSNLLCWTCTKSIILRENSHFVDKLVGCCVSCTNR